MKKNYNKELLDKIKNDLEERLSSFDELPSTDSKNNSISSHESNSIPLKNQSSETLDTHNKVDDNPVFELSDSVNPIQKNSEYLEVKPKKTKSKRNVKRIISIPAIILIGLSLLILGFIYKKNIDLKKKIAIENELNMEKINYKIKDDQYKDVKDDFFDDELQEIDVKEKEKAP